jgi:transglutaminase-like putative cysteine protease
MAIRTRVLAVSDSVRALPLVAGAVLLALVVGASTVRADWVSGADALPGLAVYASLVGSALGLSSARAWLGMTLALLPAPVAAFVTVAGTPQAGQLLGLDLAQRWWRELPHGQAAMDPGFLLFLLYVLFWLLGVWLAWGLVRRHQPLLAAAPAGAVLATNVLNFPDGQDSAVFWFIVLVLGLLLWCTYQDSLAAARRRGVELADGARWDFWERGAVAAAALVALGVLVPPLSLTDRTADLQGGLTDTWARITHNGGGSGGALTSVGFSNDVRLGGPLTLAKGDVLAYTIVGDAPGPSYLRGLDLQPLQGEWGFVSTLATGQRLPSGQEVSYAESYREQQRATYAISVLRPPASAPTLVLSPGQFSSVNRDVVAGQSRTPTGLVFPAPQLDTVDQVTAASGAGTYQVQVEQSVASEAELRADSTTYADWLRAYLGLRFDYRSPATLRRIRDLAVQVTAGATNPYDKAVAVEQYLRTNYRYTLTPPAPVGGADPEEDFLFNGRAGYCQYFATAMADMLRSIGVPVRLVNGYGPGNYDSVQQRFVVKESDAHTWPEVYFPSYGWVPFEPTPDGVYLPIPRGAGSGVSCTSSGGCTDTSGAPLPTPASAATPKPRPDRTSPGSTGGVASALTLPALRSWTPVAAVVLLVLVLLLVMASRFLRPQTVAGVWRRATLLLQLAGVRRRVGETPIEFGDRVAGEFPETAAGIRQLAGDFAVAAYAPTRLASARRPSVLAGWGSLLPLLLRRVVGRLHARPSSPGSS